MNRLLLTYFEPFGGDTVNASEEAVRVLLKTGVPGLELDTLRLPVARVAAVDLLLTHLGKTSPNSVVMLGEASGRSQVTPERVALNVDDYSIPDNTGAQPRNEAVVAGGPAAYFSALPVHDMVERMTAAGYPAAVSNSAGTYLCNRVFYAALHWASAEQPALRAGFIHVPHLPEQAAAKPEGHPSLPAETTALALAAGLAALRPAI